MGRGRGGYTKKQVTYRDSGFNKVTDKGAIFVAERYIEMGYEVVFRQKHDDLGQKTYDLTIKTSDDTKVVKNIEVKSVTSSNPSQLAKNIKRAFEQAGEGDTVSIVLPNRVNDSETRKFIEEGFAEACRKGHVKGEVEVWFKDKTRIKL